MRVLAGTSGFSYAEWKGSFYPADMKPAGMLAWYAARLPVVEINNTFYRSPKREVVRHWGEQVPETFRFVLKAPQRITHYARLMGVAEAVGYLWAAGNELGPRLGPFLFQLPPNMRADTERLAAFLGELPAGMRVALEVRNDSWLTDDVRALLARHGAALVAADTDEQPLAELAATAPFGYLRLRRESYADADLARFAALVRAQPWEEAYVFFKHEDGARGPAFASRFLELGAGP